LEVVHKGFQFSFRFQEDRFGDTQKVSSKYLSIQIVVGFRRYQQAVVNSSENKLRLMVDNLVKSQKDFTAAPKTLETVERDHIVRLLEQTQWKVSGKTSAAEILGLNRSALRTRMGKFDIRKP
jgi:transcriptional regulator with GAF, ATPase, and Fis domain